MFEWLKSKFFELKNKLFGVKLPSYPDQPTVEIITLSQKPKKIVSKIKPTKKPAVKKATVKKKTAATKEKK